MASRASSVSFDLTEGYHPVVLDARPSEFGGMAFQTELSSSGRELLSLKCRHPCDPRRLVDSSGGRLACSSTGSACPGTEVCGVSASGAAGGAIEVRFTIFVAPNLLPEDRAARGCP